jgi:hypothetical protein
MSSTGLPLQKKLRIVPCVYREAAAYVGRFHRHHIPPRGTRFALAVADEDGAIRGVALVGRPVARNLDDGWTLEVNRVATDGCENACSALYGAAKRAAKALGYSRLVTYIREDEPGTSLRAAGWENDGNVPPTSWNVPSRMRQDKTEVVGRTRWITHVTGPEPLSLSWPEADNPQLGLLDEDAA